MNAFVKKEIRLVLPGWLAILSLAIISPWLFLKDSGSALNIMPLFFFFAMILLAVDSFGREFSLGTFSSLMAQPMERRRIWRTKIILLFSAATVIFAVYFISSWVLLKITLDNPTWNHVAKIITDEFLHTTMASAVTAFIALTGGLWTTLLIRQVAAAFWITFIVPLGLAMLIVFFMPSQLANNDRFVAGLAGIYCVGGFWFAHRLFHRSQDAAWTGGVISFSTWRYFEGRSRNSDFTRVQKPFSALLKKEFQLHSLNLLFAGALLVLQIGVFLLRAFDSHLREDPNSLAAVTSEFFWALWLILPLTIGCIAVAEERKLGVMDGQFCLPVSRRSQFALKFIPTLFFGTLLGGIMPLLLETAAAFFGVPNDYFKPDSHMGESVFSGVGWFYFCIIAGAASLAMLGLLASTLAKNFMQAISIAITGIVACFLFETLLTGGHFLSSGDFAILGKQLWGVGLPILVGIATAVTFLPWLAWRNYSYFVEGGRLWRRNLLGIIVAILFVFASSAAIYNRAWEYLEPTAAHGAPKLFLSNPPVLQAHGYYYDDSLQVRLPDGRVWFDIIDIKESQYNDRNPWKLLWWAMVSPLPSSVGPQQFMSDSNWISVALTRGIRMWNNHHYTHGYSDTIGIQDDGSLWISSPGRLGTWTGTNMIRYGVETDWKQVAWRNDNYFLLLKNNGTLWRWTNKQYDWNGRQTNWPSVRADSPRQIGTNSDWQKIIPDLGAQKIDGAVWLVNYLGRTNDTSLFRDTNLDQIVPQTYSGDSGTTGIYVSTNGTLQFRTGKGFFQLGTETNWATVAFKWNQLVALKTNGSLWQWDFTQNYGVEIDKIPPMQLDKHNDWVGLTRSDRGIIALAADGSLWFWPGYEYNGNLMKATRRPQFLANVFDKRD